MPSGRALAFAIPPGPAHLQYATDTADQVAAVGHLAGIKRIGGAWLSPVHQHDGHQSRVVWLQLDADSGKRLDAIELTGTVPDAKLAAMGDLP